MGQYPLFSIENPLFKSYLFYCSILVLKMMLLSILTGRQRMSKKVFSNPEDCALSSKAKIKFDDPDVERIRRAHLNDLENIPIFFVAACGYMATGPPAWLYLTLLRAFTLCRVLHTFVYAIMVVPQPARALAFFGGYGITAFMAIFTIKNLW